MKKLIKPIIATLLMGSVFFANASTLPAKPTLKTYAFSMYKNDGKATINLFINKLKGSQVQITIKNANGDVLFTEKMYKNDTNYRTKFDLNALEKGVYNIELNDGANIEHKQFEI